MKKIILIGIIFIIFLSPNSLAHSPSSMNLNYNSEKNELNINITHTVSNPNTHYIYNIKIEKNNKPYKNYNYTNQPTSSSFSYNFNDINITDGDVIIVNAYCNKGGQLTRRLNIGSIVQEKNETPGFEIILILIGIILITILKRKKI